MFESEQTVDQRRESRLRHAVARQGYALRKSRRRNSRPYASGGWAILEPYLNCWVAGMSAGEYTMDLDDVEAWVED